jgi:hypothetical protein
VHPPDGGEALFAHALSGRKYSLPPAAVNGDFFTLDLIRDRILHALATSDVVRINTQLEELMSAVGDEDFAAMAEEAGALRDIVAELKPVN